MPTNKRTPKCARGRTKGRLAKREALRRLKAIPGVYVAKGGKPRGACRPIKIKPGQKSLAEIALDDRR